MPLLFNIGNVRSPETIEEALLSGHSLRHAVNIASNADELRKAVTTAHGLKGWTGADVSGDGSRWTLTYTNGPTFVWEIASRDPHEVVWKCIEGPGDSAGTTATFTFDKVSDGRVHLKFEHAGWPHQEGNFAKCNTLWGLMLHQLRAFAEQGKVAHAHS
jgi:hypothetical protein